VVVHLVDFGGIVDHHCLNFIFIKWVRVMVFSATVNNILVISLWQSIVILWGSIYKIINVIIPLSI
jgi:hypothetical protein